MPPIPQSRSTGDPSVTATSAADTSSLGPPEIREESLLFNNTLLASDLATGSVGTDEVQDDALTGSDINESTLVGLRDGCPGTSVLRGRICVGGDGALRTWDDTWRYCAGLGLRLPSVGESLTLALNYDIPAIAETDYFWTDDFSDTANSTLTRVLVSDQAKYFPFNAASQAANSVCVDTPTDA